jgi:APA family basic amino acid/polyamine antiporter
MEANEGLKRVIGVKGLATTVVNNTIGAGIFVLSAKVCIRMGASGILAYGACGIMLVAIILCYMEIGSKITVSGGSYIYVEKTFGPLAGFIINWLFFFGWGVLGSAAILNVITDSLAVIFPIFAKPAIRILAMFILQGIMVWVNVRSVKGSIKFVEFVTFIKVIPLIGIIIFGFTYIKPVNLHWEHLPAIHTFGGTVLVLFFAFAGFETSLNSSGEIINPKRTIPRGILLGALAVFIFYGLINTVVQGVLGADVVKFKDAPLAAVAYHIIGPAGATVLLVATIISCFGNSTGDLLATPRLLFAGARDGLFPKPLAKVHPKFATPYIAVITYGAIIFLFAVLGGFDELAVLASCSMLLIYLTVVLAMLKLRSKKNTDDEKTFKVPGGYIIPVIAIAAIIWLLVNLERKEQLSTLVFIAIICIIYFVMKLLQNKKLTAESTDNI